MNTENTEPESLWNKRRLKILVKETMQGHLKGYGASSPKNGEDMLDPVAEFLTSTAKGRALPGAVDEITRRVTMLKNALEEALLKVESLDPDGGPELQCEKGE